MDRGAVRREWTQLDVFESLIFSYYLALIDFGTVHESLLFVHPFVVIVLIFNVFSIYACIMLSLPMLTGDKT